MKATISEIEPRLIIRDNKQEGIQNYDVGNTYPQRIRLAKKSSGRATQCVNIHAKFVRAQGFADPFFKTIVNEKKRLTVDQLHRKLVADYCLYRGFAVHFNFDMNGKIVSMDHVPFEELRLGIADELTGIVQFVKHHPDWGKESGKYFKKELIRTYPVYNPSLVVEQGNLTGFDKYSGQIYWWSANGLYRYPESAIDPILEDVVADNEAKNFRLNNISRSFMASHILETPQFDNEDDREAFQANVKDFQGAKNTSRILHLEKTGTESSFDLKKIDIQDMDGLFKDTETSVLDSIRRNFQLLPVILGDLISGSRATAQEIRDAIDFTNNFITVDDRMIFEECFKEWFSLWSVPNLTNDFTVAPLNYPINVASSTVPAPAVI